MPRTGSVSYAGCLHGRFPLEQWQHTTFRVRALRIKNLYCLSGIELESGQAQKRCVLLSIWVPMS